MTHVVLTSAIVLMVLGSPLSAQLLRGQSQTVDSAFDYDAFMRLPSDQRRERLAAMRATDRALIVRTHATRWLAANRARLSPTEIAIFDELIAFIRPELYAPRPNPAIDEEERALRTRMRCRVNPDDVRAAFMVIGASPEVSVSAPRWTFLDRASCWLEWATEEVAPYLRD